MGILIKLGRVFYGLAVFETGLQTIYYGDFPYWLVPPRHAWIPGISLIAYAAGILLILAGASIILKKRIRPVSLLLGGVLLAVFCFGFIPFVVKTSPDIRWLVWHNAEKELAFTAGALIIAGQFSAQTENGMMRFLARLIPIGTIGFSLAMISFGIAHFRQAKDVATMVPAWIPSPVFWTYLAGAGLLASGIAFILKVRVWLAGALLGSMILTWFIILHIPRIINSPAPYLGSEVTSAFIALAYSGIAYVIAGAAKK